MKTYIVEMREVHVQPVRVQAESESDAIKRVVKGEGDYINNGLEYSHTLDAENWTAKEEQEHFF